MLSRANLATANTVTRSTTRSASAATTLHSPSGVTKSTEGTFAKNMTELVTGKALPNVVVTGIAMTTALATDAEGTWKLLLDSQSGIRTLTDPFVEEFKLPVRIGGHLLEEFDHHLTRVELRRTS